MGREIVVPDFEKVDRSRDFSGWLRFLQFLVAQGYLEQYWDFRGVGASREAIADIDPAGPWPDEVLMFFFNRQSGKYYRFSVETYHGAGGEWQRIERGQEWDW